VLFDADEERDWPRSFRWLRRVKGARAALGAEEAQLGWSQERESESEEDYEGGGLVLRFRDFQLPVGGLEEEGEEEGVWV
jgi:hypothetical protein